MHAREGGIEQRRERRARASPMGWREGHGDKNLGGRNISRCVSRKITGTHRACIVPRGVSAAVNQNCRNANAEIGQVNYPREKKW